MLAGLDPLVILCMPRDGTQDDLLHQLPRHRGQADGPVVPRILLPALLEDGCHICYPPVNWDFPSSPGLLVNDGKQLGEHICQFLQYSQVDLIRPHRLPGTTPEQASNPGKLTRHLREGCLAYPNENQQLLALYWGLACAYRATVQYSQRTVVEIETQTTTTVIAPAVKKKQWTRRSTGPYHRLVREEEEEEGFDQEAGPFTKKLEEGVAQKSNLTLNVSRDGASTTSLGNLFQCLTTLTVKDFFLKASLNLPSLSLKPLFLVLSQQALLKILEGCYKVSPQPSLLQAEQPQLSQPVLVGEVLQPSDHLHGPPLDSLQQLHVLLVLRAPELDAVLQVRSHQSGVEWQNHLPRPAGHASFDAAQDTVGLLGCERTLLAHVQLFIHQYPSLYWNRGLPQPRCRTLHLALLNLMRFTQAHFSSLPRSLWMTSRPSGVSTAPLSLVSSANLLRVHSISLSMSLMKILNSTGPTVDRYPLDATIQPIPYPLNSPPIKSISLQFREKDVAGDRFSSSWALAFLTPSLHNRAVSLYSSQVTRPCLCSSLLLFSLTSIHAGLFPSLPDFLHLGIKSSCALWKASLKICQLCSTPLSLRTVSQGVPLTNSLKSWKFAFLKFRVLTILFACPISLRTANSTNA
ncbi:hypothetical protein QYF61_008835 [Mycteria americana]|uniref:Uncharacterized protein n=1 Tax=Mycteria americana TaxID=33587 RepID=A0AAN7NHI1_MYCAM|nr:hypothetical protein QYF61_008835 [Mycteria americana]